MNFVRSKETERKFMNESILSKILKYFLLKLIFSSEVTWHLEQTFWGLFRIKFAFLIWIWIFEAELQSFPLIPSYSYLLGQCYSNYAPRHTSLLLKPSNVSWNIWRLTNFALHKWFSVSRSKKFENHCSRTSRNIHSTPTTNFAYGRNHCLCWLLKISFSIVIIS
jgi:hypothetical protein